MGEQPTRPRFLNELLLLVAALAGALMTVELVRRAWHVPWSSAASIPLVAAASFWVLRCCQNKWWALAVSVALPFHPWYGAWLGLYEPELRAEGLVLVVL